MCFRNLDWFMRPGYVYLIAGLCFCLFPGKMEHWDSIFGFINSVWLLGKVSLLDEERFCFVLGS